MNGDFEIHLTVGFDPRLEAAAAGNGAKYTRILLDHGDTPDQPMLTLRRRGALDDVAAAGWAWAARLAGEGFDVRRVKVEASPYNPGVPQDGGAVPAGRYFEHHVKLALSPGELETARAIGVRHGARLSRNARRTTGDGAHERFLTQRCHACGEPEARRRLDGLVEELRAAGLVIAEVEREYVVLDSAPSVDAGWLAA